MYPNLGVLEMKNKKNYLKISFKRQNWKTPFKSPVKKMAQLLHEVQKDDVKQWVQNFFKFRTHFFTFWTHFSKFGHTFLSFGHTF